MTGDKTCRTRQDKAITWTVEHAGELAGVGLPLIAGAVFTSWLDLVSAVVAAVWAVSEVRLRRATRTTRQAVATLAPRQLTSPASIPASPETTGDTGRKEAKG